MLRHSSRKVTRLVETRTIFAFFFPRDGPDNYGSGRMPSLAVVCRNIKEVTML